MTPDVSPQAQGRNQDALLAGTLSHLSRYLDTGCRRSAHRARLLLERLDLQAGTELRESCQALVRVLDEPMPERAP